MSAKVSPVISTECSSKGRLTLEQLLELTRASFSNLLIESSIDRNHVVLQINRSNIVPLFQGLKEHAELKMNFLVSLTAVDWMDQREERFEMVYHVLSLANLGRMRIKVAVPEHAPEVDSLVPLWQSANFLEREAWDMFGIVFKGHPDLRRILLYEEFKGHPLRKDYPVQAKQPRVPLRYPEVENTARQMNRAPLVKINGKKNPGWTTTRPEARS